MELDFKSALKRIENSISYVEIKFRKMNGELRTGFFKKYKKTQTKQETFALNNTKEFHTIKDNALSLLIEKETNKVINIKVHLITQIKIGTKWVDII